MATKYAHSVSRTGLIHMGQVLPLTADRNASQRKLPGILSTNCQVLPCAYCIVTGLYQFLCATGMRTYMVTFLPVRLLVCLFVSNNHISPPKLRFEETNGSFKSLSSVVGPITPDCLDPINNSIIVIDNLILLHI